jgi:hypothetical protein
VSYATRVRFAGGHGTVAYASITRHFADVPIVPGLPVFDALDYVPSECARIKPQYDGERDMEGWEIRSLLAWAAALNAAAPEVNR